MKCAEKRGDTLIEVMFAIAIFSAVAIISIAMMNLGVANSERSLEMSTARDELNAQAEALRFIHSSYTSELTLPICNNQLVAREEKCQQFKTLWELITSRAMNPYDPNDTHNTDNYSIPSPLDACDTVYKDNNKILSDNRAFVINTRQISRVNDTLGNVTGIYISAADATTRDLFQPASLNARIIYIRGLSGETYDEDSEDSSVTGALSTDPLLYRAVGQIEGIWVVAVRDADNRFYDFYIQSCWYAPGSNAPTSLDTIIRLYNPGVL